MTFTRLCPVNRIKEGLRKLLADGGSYLPAGGAAAAVTIPALATAYASDSLTFSVYVDNVPLLHQEDGGEDAVPNAGPDILIYTPSNRPAPKYSNDMALWELQVAIDLTFPPDTSPTVSDEVWESFLLLLTEKLHTDETEEQVRHPLAWRLTEFSHPDNVTSATAAASTDLITAAAHGLNTGDEVLLSAITGGTGLTAGTEYYVIRISASTLKLATTAALASAGTPIDITSNATGITLRPSETAYIADVTAMEQVDPFRQMETGAETRGIVLTLLAATEVR